ncbi:hypothetical protein LENED_010571 [Lentinula edodes]|uniref:Uncharacterized protein n=1 Tax=Lentinula edodes TaxID=5353 RepID=A0A1Q3EMS9_LENED|nr:hypothetical protein LENED_010571 [Lentinula edodes]
MFPATETQIFNLPQVFLVSSPNVPDYSAHTHVLCSPFNMANHCIQLSIIIINFHRDELKIWNLSRFHLRIFIRISYILTCLFPIFLTTKNRYIVPEETFRGEFELRKALRSISI